MKRHKTSDIAPCLGAVVMSLAVVISPVAAADPGKKACVKEARTLCPAAMKSMSRKKVEACMIANIEKTSPVCKSAMLKIKAEREAKAARKAKSAR